MGTRRPEVPGFDELEEKWGKPPVALTFWMYRVMIGIGVMLAADERTGMLCCLAWEVVRDAVAIVGISWWRWYRRLSPTRRGG